MEVSAFEEIIGVGVDTGWPIGIGTVESVVYILLQLVLRACRPKSIQKFKKYGTYIPAPLVILVARKKQKTKSILSILVQ